MTSLALLLLLIVFGLAGPLSAQGDVVTEDQRLAGADGDEDDAFGAAVAIDGNTMVVGANRAAAGDQSFAGAAYVFELINGQWLFGQTITSPNAIDGDFFANTVDIDGDTIVIGAANEGVQRGGAAYVFVRSDGQWTQQSRLVLSGGEPFDAFGASVAIDADTIVVGATRGEGRSGDDGAAYVFTRTNAQWAGQAVLAASNGDTDDRFGERVAISDGTIIVGSPRAQDQGAAYVFVGSGDSWSEEAILEAENSGENDEFGDAVAIDGDTVVVGAPRAEGNGIGLSGAAYVFTRVGTLWAQQEVLIGSDTQTGDFFGAAVSIDGNFILVGATFGDSAGGAAGSAYMFARTGLRWVEQEVLGSSSPAVSDRFGAAVDLSDRSVVVGAPSVDIDGQTDTGAALVFQLDDVALVRCENAAITVNLAVGDEPTDGDDVILGTSGPDVINGGDGDDIICGQGGDDVINGGDGKDLINGGSGDDTINSGQGLDTVFGEGGDDFVSGGRGKDTIFGGAGDDDLRGNEGTDTIDGGAGDDELRGGQKADLLVGGTGNDELIGGTRPDVLDGGPGLDRFNGGSGVDACVADPDGDAEASDSCELR